MYKVRSLPSVALGVRRYFVGVACFAVECFTEWLLLSRAAPSVDHHFKMSSTCGSSFFACKSNHCHASALLCPWFLRCLVPSCSPWACLVLGCSHFCRLVARRSVSASVPTLVIFKVLGVLELQLARCEPEQLTQRLDGRPHSSGVSELLVATLVVGAWVLCELIFAVCALSRDTPSLVQQILSLSAMAHANPWRLAVGPRSWPSDNSIDNYWNERRCLALGRDGTWVGATPDMDIYEERLED